MPFTQKKAATSFSRACKLGEIRAPQHSERRQTLREHHQTRCTAGEFQSPPTESCTQKSSMCIPQKMMKIAEHIDPHLCKFTVLNSTSERRPRRWRVIEKGAAHVNPNTHSGR